MWTSTGTTTRMKMVTGTWTWTRTNAGIATKTATKMATKRKEAEVLRSSSVVKETRTKGDLVTASLGRSGALGTTEVERDSGGFALAAGSPEKERRPRLSGARTAAPALRRATLAECAPRACSGSSRWGLDRRRTPHARRTPRSRRSASFSARHDGGRNDPSQSRQPARGASVVAAVLAPHARTNRVRGPTSGPWVRVPCWRCRVRAQVCTRTRPGQGWVWARRVRSRLETGWSGRGWRARTRCWSAW